VIKKIPYPDRQAWLELRKKAIGGSDAAAIARLSQWASPLSVYADKLGLVPEREDNEAMRQGRDLEEYVAQRFVEETGLKVRKENHILVNSKYPFMHANIDRKIVGKNIGLECKTTSVYNKTDFSGGEIPEYYYVQCMHYLAVTGWDSWYLAVLVLNKGFYWFHIQRNPEDIYSLVEMEERFWNMHVIPAVPPEPEDIDSQLVKDLYPEAVDSYIPLNHISTTLQQLANLKTQKKEMDGEIVRLENIVKMELGESTNGSDGRFEVSWKERLSNRFDSAAFKKEFPSAYKVYTRESKSRTFIIKESKKEQTA